MWNIVYMSNLLCCLVCHPYTIETLVCIVIYNIYIETVQVCIKQNNYGTLQKSFLWFLLVTLVYIHLLLHRLMFINGLRTVWECSWTAPEGSWTLWKLFCKVPYKLRCQGCHEFFFGLSLPLYAIVLVQGSNWSYNQNGQCGDCPPVVWLLCLPCAITASLLHSQLCFSSGHTCSQCNTCIIIY